MSNNQLALGANVSMYSPGSVERSIRNFVLLSFNQTLLMNFDIYRNENSLAGEGGGSCEVKEFLDFLTLDDGTDRLSRNNNPKRAQISFASRRKPEIRHSNYVR